MGGIRCGNVLGALKAEFDCVKSTEKMLPRTEQSRRDGQMHLVNESRADVLLDCCNPAAEPDVLTSCGVSRAFKRGMDSVGHEMEGRSPSHGDRRPSVVSQHEDWHVVRRVVAPPPLPVFVGPRTSDWSEHVSTDNPRANVGKAACGEFIVAPGGSTLLAKHASKATGLEGPFVKRAAADPERIAVVLVRPSPVAIDGY